MNISQVSTKSILLHPLGLIATCKSIEAAKPSASVGSNIMKYNRNICIYDSAVSRRAHRERAVATRMLITEFNAYSGNLLVRFIPSLARRAT